MRAKVHVKFQCKFDLYLTHPKLFKHETKPGERGGEKFHLMQVRLTRDSPSNEVLRARTKPRFVRRQIFERPRNGKRKMRYLANTKRIQYPEKKCIRIKLDTCEK